ncbi:hypothetical protein VINI7043_00327 [Vibrio nigripulchritudo ATCC 27043]|uniref:hypothetical protein n=1 Tax=Vibrio nigripulchritudo TaxID=28173 RepID=UPI00021C3E4C|nr:hypothetical protein [Vibrio nigripulchritudo]EGU60139.1 hypothetical protein VINI7043_00327 [Vibrio nigripulchritudo ATCC 27043]
MSDESSGWGTALAEKWTNYYPPCRVSASELQIYSNALKEIRNKFRNERIKVLILGSTSEFRDWAHEENLDTTVVDFSLGYYQKISEQMKYKHAKSELINKRWQEMEFSEEFHIVVGDLVVGNVNEFELPDFLNRVRCSLIAGGVFVTKSFFSNSEYRKSSLDSILSDASQYRLHGNVFSRYIFDIAMHCLNVEENTLSFSYMHQEIYRLYKLKLIDEDVFNLFDKLGWQDNMKFSFFMPSSKLWEDKLLSIFSDYQKAKSQDVYSDNFNVYTIYK